MKFKSGFATLVGRPNVGKSTLLNALVNEKIAITSNKPQTTRNTIKAIVTEKDFQIVFIDTPGMHRPKTKLGEFMVNAAVNTIGDVDVILFITDSADPKAQKEDIEILHRIHHSNIPLILVLNKIDLVNKEALLPLIQFYSEQFRFQAILPVSAMKQEGLDAIKKELQSLLPEGPKFFPDEMITDQPERVIVAEILREKLMRCLDDEIPHGIGIEIISFKERADKQMVDIQANIYCEKDSHKGIIIGKQGKMLKKIGSTARKDMERFLDIQVFLELWVKVKEGWRDSEFMLKSLGYRKE